MRNPEGPRSIMLSDRTPIESSIKSEDIFYTELSKPYLNYRNLILYLMNIEQGPARVSFVENMVKCNILATNNVFKALFNKRYVDRVDENLIDDFLNPKTKFKNPININEAITTGNIIMIKKILEIDPDSVNAPSLQGNYPIGLAVLNSKKDVLKELVKSQELNLYSRCALRTLRGIKFENSTVFDIAKVKNNLEIIKILENEHQMRLMAKNPDAMQFEKHRVSKEIASSSINPEASQQSSQFIQETVMVWEEARHESYCFFQLSDHEEIEKMITARDNGNLYGVQPQITGGGSIIGNGEWSSSDLAPFNPPINSVVDSDSIGSEIATASDKSTNARLQMASPLINPDAPQASSQLYAESPMVWDNPEHLQFYSDNFHLSAPEMANMYMPVAESENGISVFRPRFILAANKTNSLDQIMDSINENHKARDPQPISASIGPDTSSRSAFSSPKQIETSNNYTTEEEVTTKFAKTTSEDRQSITSRISPTSQESLSGSDQGKGGSK
jgi:hypothetical protein